MTRAGLFRWMSAGIIAVSVTACSSAEDTAEAPAASTAAASTPAATNADNPCPLTIEQVAAITGVPMTATGGCTFFPADGRDIPHVFYVLQNPMVCSSIKPSDLGFTETVEGLPARTAYVRDLIDGSHVLVCRDNDARAFDIVVDLRGEKPRNRDAAIALAKQVLAGR